MSFSVRSGSYIRRIAAVLTLVSLGGCIPLSPNSSFLQDKLKIASAGYTGCMPNDNVISNVGPYPISNYTWNATCKDKVYLCSAVSGYDEPTQYHCALAAE